MILPYMMICAFSSLNTWYEVSGTDSVQTYLLVSQFTAFLHIEGLWWPSVKQLLSVLSFNSICSPYVSVLHFGNSHHYSKIFHFDYICYDDLWSVISDVTIAKSYDSLKAQEDSYHILAQNILKLSYLDCFLDIMILDTS